MIGVLPFSYPQEVFKCFSLYKLLNFKIEIATIFSALLVTLVTIRCPELELVDKLGPHKLQILFLERSLIKSVV